KGPVRGARDEFEGAVPDERGRLSPAPPVEPLAEPQKPASAATAAEAGPRPRWHRRLLRHVVVDLGPLRRHREFRLLWLAQAVTMLGSMVTYVAIPYQAFQLTHSSLVVGLLSAVEFAPLLIVPLVGGALADAVDRRRLVLLAELLLAGASVALLVNALIGAPRLWVLFVVAGSISAFDGLQRPPLDALLPRLVERDELTAAGAISSLRWTAGSILGPALGGVLIASVGLAAAYAFDIVTFAASLALLSLMRAVPPPEDAERPSVRGVVDGLRYAFSRQVLLGTYTVDIIAMFFGMPLALFPALAEGFGGARALGLLYAAPEVGALLATLTSGWSGRVHRHGAAVCLAAAGWGAGIVLLGFAPSLRWALVALIIAGFADMISGIFRMVIWNQTIPDRLRGRLAGIEQISYSTGPTLGNVEAGAVATLTSVRVSIASGGLLCVAGVGVAAVFLKQFRRYDARRGDSGAGQTGADETGTSDGDAGDATSGRTGSGEAGPEPPAI
ncbi:MAG TPA: MFS transporter, partial [Thermoleophilia bacterium]|nr:MFS transporter [Thermoleophilia bacterium]